NEDHPFTFTEDLPGLFFIEGVVGAGEVKTILTQDNLEQSLQSSRQFKALQLEAGEGTLVSSNPSDLERLYTSPLWFLFCYESLVEIRKICGRLMKEQREDGAPATNLVDAVFVLGKGWAINFGDGKGACEFRTPQGESLRGWVWNHDEGTLFQLMTWFSSVM